MLEGTDLAKAIRDAIALKNDRGRPKVGPTALGKALGISQPSASELLNTGRISKSKLPALLEFFQDVVGPDHFGLPYTKFEADFLTYFRRLPPGSQKELFTKVELVAKKVDAAVADFGGEAAPELGKRDGTKG